MLFYYYLILDFNVKNKLQMGPINILIIFYITTMHVLSVGSPFKCLHVLFRQVNSEIHLD